MSDRGSVAAGNYPSSGGGAEAVHLAPFAERQHPVVRIDERMPRSRFCRNGHSRGLLQIVRLPSRRIARNRSVVGWLVAQRGSNRDFSGFGNSRQRDGSSGRCPSARWDGARQRDGSSGRCPSARRVGASTVSATVGPDAASAAARSAASTQRGGGTVHNIIQISDAVKFMLPLGLSTVLNHDL
jgi:hypothetical protein